jgi:hypothetical protein
MHASLGSHLDMVLFLFLLGSVGVFDLVHIVSMAGLIFLPRWPLAMV